MSQREGERERERETEHACEEEIQLYTCGGMGFSREARLKTMLCEW
jgi:hypothetical protein